MNELDKIIEERGKEYGSFKTQANLAQTLKNTLEMNANWENLESYMKESLHQQLHKISRILNGNCRCVDSWQDIAGYAQLVVKELESENRG